MSESRAPNSTLAELPEVVFLHGFLGEGRDGEFLRDFFPKLQCPSYLATAAPTTDLERILRESLREGRSLAAAASGWPKFPKPPVVIGYSLGARLALRATLQGWPVHSLVILSAAPGLFDSDPSESEMRQARLNSDLRWAGRFESDDWTSVVGDWNREALPGGLAAEWPRFEAQYDRRLLGSALRHWSQALQPDLRPELPHLRCPVLWIAGVNDRKYASLMQPAAALSPAGTFRAILDAGHRVIQDQPRRTAETIHGWLSGSSAI